MQLFLYGLVLGDAGDVRLVDTVHPSGGRLPIPRFRVSQVLSAEPIKVHQEGRLNKKLKQLSQAKLLVIDEIGYIPIDRLGANLFFQLISRRYEKSSIILTSNQNYTNWGKIFGDPLITSAILHRVLHHASTINIKGERYRLKEKRKTGLLSRHGEDASKTETV